MTISSNKARIVIIDAQKLRQAGLVRLLENWAETNGLQVTAISPPEELTVGPNCAMVVVNVGGASVLEREPQLWIKSVRTIMRDVPLVILSDREDRSEIRAAFKEGAKGFIATNLDPSLALDALTFLHRGGSFFPSSALLEDPRSARDEASGSAREMAVAPMFERAGSAEVRRTVRVATWRTSQVSSNNGASNGAGVPDGHANHALTPRQHEVLERLREGKPNKVIARDLNMTEATVKVHVRQIMRKFGAANRTQVVLSAMRFTAAVAAKQPT